MSQPLPFSITSVPPELFTYLPTFAFVLTAPSYLFGLFAANRAVIGTGLARTLNGRSPPDATSAENKQYVVVSRRGLVLALQIAVGSLVAFGGTAYVSFALNSLGTAFGSGHLLVGISGLSIGIWAVSRKDLPRGALLGINLATIAYSLFSDVAAGVLTLLPTGAFHDSVIGTAAAVFMSGVIVYLLVRR